MSTTESLRSMKTSILRMKRKLNIFNLEYNTSILKNAHSVVYQSNLQEKQNQSHVSAINTTDILKLELCIALIPKLQYDQRYVDLSSEICTISPSTIYTRLTNGNDRLAVAPHLTLYQCAIPYFHLPKLINELDSKINATGFHHVKVNENDEILYNGHEGSVEIKTSLPLSLALLQCLIVTTCNDHRNGLYVEKSPDGERVIDSIDKDTNVRLYGWAEGVNQFSPHVTLAWVDKYEINDDDWLKYINFKPQTIEFDKIGLYIMGNRGTCVQLLRSFPLVSEIKN